MLLCIFSCSCDDVFCNSLERNLFLLKSLLCVLLGGSFGRFVQKKLGGLNLWEDPYYLVKENLKAGASICEQWVMVCTHLTGQVWQRYVPHPWKSERYFPETLDKLGKRLEEVSDYLMFVFKC